MNESQLLIQMVLKTHNPQRSALADSVSAAYYAAGNYYCSLTLLNFPMENGRMENSHRKPERTKVPTIL